MRRHKGVKNCNYGFSISSKLVSLWDNLISFLDTSHEQENSLLFISSHRMLKWSIKEKPFPFYFFILNVNSQRKFSRKERKREKSLRKSRKKTPRDNFPSTFYRFSAFEEERKKDFSFPPLTPLQSYSIHLDRILTDIGTFRTQIPPSTDIEQNYSRQRNFA